MEQDFERVLSSFNKNTRDHVLEVFVDNGVNRIMRFGNKDGSTPFSVKIMQTHGEIAYMGDMGDFCFSNHNADMLGWFHGNTSLHYIDEKCRAGITEEYNAETAKKWIKEDVRDYCDQNFFDYIDVGDEEEITDKEYQARKTAWVESLTSKVLGEIDFENEYTLHSSVNDVEIKINDWLTYTAYNDDGYINCNLYTNRLLWCVVAINKIAELYFSGEYVIEVQNEIL